METFALQLLSALVGGVIVYVFGARKSSIEIRNSFLQKQLAEFYSPIAGYGKRIKAQSTVREKIASAANQAWGSVCAATRDVPKQDIDERFAPYKKIIDYDNTKFLGELMPLYRKILDLFTEKYWLADADTRAYYQDFLEFVEIWERHLASALPSDVIKELGHTEANVQPFYEHVENRLSNLQSEIKTPVFWKLWL